MKIAAKIGIGSHEEALIEEYIKNMKQEHVMAMADKKRGNSCYGHT